MDTVETVTVVTSVRETLLAQRNEVQIDDRQSLSELTLLIETAEEVLEDVSEWGGQDDTP